MYKFLIVYLILFFSEILIAQSILYQDSKYSQAVDILEDIGEIEIKFKVETIDKINKDLTRIMSIEKLIPMPERQGYEVYAYASFPQFQEFLNRNLEFDIIRPIQVRSLKMADTITEMSDWDAYPTYHVYEQMMANFAAKYPTLCRIDTILSSTPTGNYKILVAKISKNPDRVENEPQFLYTSSIHGNETGGFILMLRLIDHLLKNYNFDAKIRNIIDNVEIWICPLANPDGTYFKSDPPGSSIAGARRYNINNIDLNRNYPDPDLGENPDGNSYQPETKAFMNFANDHHFNMSANFHSGAELLNYPWDAWITEDNLNADAEWWEKVCSDYVDTARLVSQYYMASIFPDGVSEGGDWYVINGGRQDYMNYFKNCREVTIEIDNRSITETQNLNIKWQENYRSLINFIQESLYGVRGVVSDSCTGETLRAKVWVEGYDQKNDSSQVYSALPIGNYHKYMIAGNYNIIFSAVGYVPKTIENVVLNDGQATVLDVQLVPLSFTNTMEKPFSELLVYPNPSSDILNIEFGMKLTDHLSISIYSCTGQRVYEERFKVRDHEGIDISSLANGLYILKISNDMAERYIKFHKMH